MYAHAQIFGYQTPTAGAVLRCIPWVYQQHDPASFCRFAREVLVCTTAATSTCGSSWTAIRWVEGRGDNLVIQPLERHQIETIWTIDRSEVHHQLYRLRGDDLELTPGYFELHRWPLGQIEHANARS
jgi:hypothetical protein